MNATRQNYQVKDVSYEVVEEIGKGGMGTIYKARDRNGKAVAIKELFTLNWRTIDRVRRGINLRIQHPEISPELVVNVLAHNLMETGQNFIIHPFIEGELASGYLWEKPATLITPEKIDQAKDFLRRIIPALEALIGAGLIHRDLKGTNIILPPEKEKPAVALDIDTLSETGLTDQPFGSIYYIPPEALNERAPLHPTHDIYSLACEILYIYLPQLQYLINIGNMFQETQAVLDARYYSKATAHPSVQTKLRNLSEYPENVREEIAGLIEFLIYGLMPDPKDRPKNGTEILQLINTKPNTTMYYGPKAIDSKPNDNDH